MDSPWRIVCPGLVFNLGIAIAALVCAVWTTGGVLQFCAGLEESHTNISWVVRQQSHMLFMHVRK